MGTTLGTTISLPTGSFYVAYQITLGQVLLAALILLVLITLIMKWFADWMYWR